jgi:hypothetical protein
MYNYAVTGILRKWLILQILLSNVNRPNFALSGAERFHTCHSTRDISIYMNVKTVRYTRRTGRRFPKCKPAFYGQTHTLKYISNYRVKPLE